ncbi:MAG: hypothetical protein AAF404_23085 [Pseudomonadota bacterium]
MKKQFLSALLAVTTALTLFACANTTTRKVPFIPGTDTSKVVIFVDNDTGEVILSGQVKRGIDKHNIEKHLREEHGYSNITNQLTFE